MARVILRKRFGDEVLLKFHAPEISGLARPGNFVLIRCDGFTLRRPLSIYDADEEGIWVLFRIVGRGTRFLSDADEAEVYGPFGNAFDVRGDNVLLIAGGVGKAPLHFLAKRLSGKKITFLIGERRASPFPDDIDFLPITEDGSRGRRGLVTDYVDEYISDAQDIFLSGPVSMYREARKKIHGKRAFITLEGVMGCGIGACYSCSVRTKRGIKRICKDGPSFELRDINLDDIYEPLPLFRKPSL